MRYRHGSITVTGSPSIAWIQKMMNLGMIFTHKNGQVIAEFERSDR